MRKCRLQFFDITTPLVTMATTPLLLMMMMVTGYASGVAVSEQRL